MEVRNVDLKFGWEVRAGETKAAVDFVDTHFCKLSE